VEAVSGSFVEPILHVDMDAFFVEVERLRRPELRDRPVLVGGLGPRAVVAAASYEARTFGVGSAMPMVEARRRCPQAVLVPPDQTEYRAASELVFDVLRSFTPLVEGLSVDEAFLDISGLRLHFDDPLSIAEAIRRSLKKEVGLPASVGCATNKFIAKIASDDAKPDGVLRVPAGTESAFLSPMSVRRLWGVGEASFAGLEVLGISTVADVMAATEASLRHRLGESLGRHLWELAHGRDERPVVPRSAAKSISVEHTYPRDLTSDRLIEDEVFKHCNALSGRLVRAGVRARTVTLKVRFGDFTTITRSLTIAGGVKHGNALWDVSRTLLERIDRAGQGVRLLGVAGGELNATSEPRQLSMTDEGRSAAATAAEQVRARFGADAVVPARLAQRPTIERRADDAD
jgi:DNA polymerase-4